MFVILLVINMNACVTYSHVGGRVDSTESVQALFTFQAASNCSAVKSSGTTPSEA